MKTFKKYAQFVTFLCAIFALSCLAYQRNIGTSDIYLIPSYYSFIAAIVYFLNRISNRRIRWLCFIIFIVFPLTLVYFLGTGSGLTDSLDFFETFSKINVPFLPNLYYSFNNRVLNILVFYVLFVLLPVIYFYGAYYLSNKTLEKKLHFFGKDNSKNQEADSQH